MLGKGVVWGGFHVPRVPRVPLYFGVFGPPFTFSYFYIFSFLFDKSQNIVEHVEHWNRDGKW
jgi:hypothetical protein